MASKIQKINNKTLLTGRDASGKIMEIVEIKRKNSFQRRWFKSAMKYNGYSVSIQHRN